MRYLIFILAFFLTPYLFVSPVYATYCSDLTTELGAELYFCEDFENGDMTVDVKQPVGWWNYIGNSSYISVVDTEVYNGTYSMQLNKFDNCGGSDCTSHLTTEVNFTVEEGSQELWITYYIQWSTDNAYGGIGNKLIRPGVIEGVFVGSFLIVNGTDQHIEHHYHDYSIEEGTLISAPDPVYYVEEGVWHKIEFYKKLNDIGSANGVERIYIDGDLKVELTGIESIPDTFTVGVLNRILQTDNYTSATNDLYKFWIDDVVYSLNRLDEVIGTEGRTAGGGGDLLW